MTEEDYVSFETAKLLKEKGFDTPVWTRYENDDVNEVIFGDKYNWNNSPMGQISAPTLQMAMKWLIENFSLYVDIELLSGPCFSWYIWLMNDPQYLMGCSIDIGIHYYDCYEQSCEAAIKYCLEKLI